MAATWWFRHQVRRLLRRVNDPRWDVLLAVAPDGAVRARDWPASLPRVAQGGGDLGARMTRMLRMCPGPVCLIGADIPGVGRTQVARAFAALGGHDGVFGPAPDGGFWLVGARHPARLPRGFFREVRWSTEHALADSLASWPSARVAFADELADVDDARDL